MTDFILGNLYELAGGAGCLVLGILGLSVGILYMLAPARSLASKRLGTNAKTVAGVRQEGVWLTLGGAGFLTLSIYLLISIFAE